MILDMLVALFISVLTGMGMGSAGLMVIYFSAVRNFPQLEAQGANMVLFIASTLFSLVLQISQKMIRWKTVIPITLAGCAGTLIGFKVAKGIDGETVKRYFAMLLIVSGVISIVKIAKDRRSKRSV